jgi:hypothetical protein
VKQCIFCGNPVVALTDVGPEQHYMRRRWYKAIPLCLTCRFHLIEGNVDGLIARHAAEARAITVARVADDVMWNIQKS